MKDKTGKFISKNGGTGFQPVSSVVGKFYKRNLPHYQSPGSMYFITFRTFKNIILLEDCRNVVLSSVLYWKDKKFDLYGAVVMPNHVHLILQPLEKFRGNFFSLTEILHSIKSYSANQINKIVGKSGSIWLDESFDRIIRGDAELMEKMNYIMNNPVKSELIEDYRDYKWLYLKGHRQDACATNGTSMQDCK